MDVLNEDTGETETIEDWAELPRIDTCKRTVPSDPWTIPVVEGYEYRVHWGRSPIDWDSLIMEQVSFEHPE